MKALVWLGLMIWILHVTACSFPSAEAGVCNHAQLLGYSPSREEVEQHRRSVRPAIHYPFGTEKWDGELLLTVRVNEAGKVACFGTKNEFDDEIRLNAKRRALINSLASWRYTPFVKGGQAVPAVFTEQIDEQEELPPEKRPLPSVPLDDVRISLSRSGCFGTCPRTPVRASPLGRTQHREMAACARMRYQGRRSRWNHAAAHRSGSG